MIYTYFITIIITRFMMDKRQTYFDLLLHKWKIDN